MSRPFLTARWHALLMLNYQVEPELLEPYLPAGTELDPGDGGPFVSLVGFRFLDTRVRGMVVPFHRHFDEVNLRFYVRREVDGETRRGVVFIRELVPRWAIAWVARRFYGERYLAVPMNHDVELPTAPEWAAGRVRYGWRGPDGWCAVEAGIDSRPEMPDIGSHEWFITEHYWGYAAQADGSTVEYRVDHPRWQVWKAKTATFEGRSVRLYGPALAEVVSGRPYSAFVAEGSEVSVLPGHRIT
jgi:hypothetical protein